LDENVKKVRTVVWNDRFLTIRLIAEELGISRNAVRLILMENVGMKKVHMQILSNNPTNNHLQQRGEIHVDLCSKSMSDRWLAQQSHHRLEV
jgi:hypothetical protein